MADTANTSTAGPDEGQQSSISTPAAFLYADATFETYTETRQGDTEPIHVSVLGPDHKSLLRLYLSETAATRLRDALDDAIEALP